MDANVVRLDLSRRGFAIELVSEKELRPPKIAQYPLAACVRLRAREAPWAAKTRSPDAFRLKIKAILRLLLYPALMA
jgi:hypothetical protein